MYVYVVELVLRLIAGYLSDPCKAEKIVTHHTKTYVHCQPKTNKLKAEPYKLPCSYKRELKPKI